MRAKTSAPENKVGGTWRPYPFDAALGKRRKMHTDDARRYRVESRVALTAGSGRRQFPRFASASGKFPTTTCKTSLVYARLPRLLRRILREGYGGAGRQGERFEFWVLIFLSFIAP